MIFDNGIKELISAAYSEKYDVFLRLPFPSLKEAVFDNARSAVLLPGAFSGFAHMPFSDFRRAEPFDVSENEVRIFTADVRYIADENFRRMLNQRNITRFIVPFAECADCGEYGYRESYSWIGEYKAETTEFCQTVAFISPSYDRLTELSGIFNCKNVISIGRNEYIEPRIYKVASTAAKFFFTASESEKFPFEKICIFFNSRHEAHQFGRFLHKRRTPYFLIDGSVPTDERRRILENIKNDGKGILLATKALLPDTVYYDFSKCILCGVPFSFSHLFRCASAAPKEKPLVIYCEDDYTRNDRISLAFSEFTGDKSIYIKRRQGLFEIKKYLESR